MNKKIIERFEKNKYALLNCKINDLVDIDEDIKKYDIIGLENAFFAPMFDINNNCNGILIVANPTLCSRSPMLIQIVAKFLSDYQVKHDIYLNEQSKLGIEPMTGLLNKIATKEKIDELLKDNQKGSFYMIDIDNFKQVNDKLGHIVGDKVILDMAKALQKIFRIDDVIGRVGGDEFIIFTPDLMTEQVISKKAEQIVNAFVKTYKENGVEVQISASIGICTSCESNNTFQYLYQQADKALYKAKAQGKNQFCIATY